MTRARQIDETSGRVGRAMHTARHVLHMSNEDAAMLLHILPNELSEYERGITKIPQDILERMFVMGYKMIHFRTMEDKYRMQRNLFRKLKQTISEIP